MRILLDTNIIIHREASRVVNPDIGMLFNWLDRLHYQKCIHPLSLEEISRHDDARVVETMRVKVSNYNQLRTESPETDPIIAIRATENSQNDYIDTCLLKELHNGRVDFLITEDRGIHRKATILNIEEKVFSISTFIEKVTAEYPTLSDYNVLAVRKTYFGNVNLDDPFFESFKADYQEFRGWFNGKSDDEAYVCVTEDQVKAFLYLKVEGTNENYVNIDPQLHPKKRLKIGTFKVESTGYKLGERFLKIIFDNAIRQNVDEIYVTIFNKRQEQQQLIYLLTDWGFKYWGEKTTQNGTEEVYVRDFSHIANREQPKETYPFVSRSGAQHIVPIYPAYHTDLFPDSILTTESPANFTENEPHRNAIQKVYVSRSINRNLSPGDAIIFYRTGGHYHGVISTIGIVENMILNIRDENHFVQLCRKRSVFDDEELKRHWNYNIHNRPFIVNFLYVCSFPTPKVNLQKMRELRLMTDAPRGFEPISLDIFNRMINEARANENYIVD